MPHYKKNMHICNPDVSGFALTAIGVECQVCNILNRHGTTTECIFQLVKVLLHVRVVLSTFAVALDRQTASNTFAKVNV